MTDKKIDNKALDQFHEYLRSILLLYQNAIPVLKEELEFILQDNIDSINECLKLQQALLLQTKSFEQNVASYLTKLNISAKTLSEMILKLPNEEQLRFYFLLGQFQQVMIELNFYKEKCRVLLQSKLYSIDKVLSKQEVQKNNTTYNQNATEVLGTLIPKSFETKI